MNMDQNALNLQQSNQFEEVRNLFLNANITVTPTTGQPKSQTHAVEEKNSSGPNPTDAKRRKYFDDSQVEASDEVSSNPLSSLPVNLISNGVLSVTSDSSRVAIENGIPILKKTPGDNDDVNQDVISKPTGLSVYPMDSKEENTPKNINPSEPPKQQSQPKMDTNNMPHSYRPSKVKGNVMTCNKLENGLATVKAPEDSTMNLISRALTNVSKMVPCFGKIGLIPHASQFDFLTLLGLEIVVDSCCPSKRGERSDKQFSLLCEQCQTDFTKAWHFEKGPSIKVLCENCFVYNEYQNIKATQTRRLVEEYAQTFRLKQNIEGPPRDMRSGNNLANRSKEELIQNFIQAADISKDGGCGSSGSSGGGGTGTGVRAGVNDLTRLGASIAANSEIFEAAKAINLLDETAAPELRAKYIQLFQMALFKELRECLSSFGAMDKTMQEQSLLFFQMTIAQMKRNSNESNLAGGGGDTGSMEPLNSILRAVEAQYQNLLMTIMKKLPPQPAN